MRANQARRIPHTLLAVSIGLVLADSARAELVEFTAKCESSVLEKIDGTTVTTAEEVKRYPDSTTVLPMQAEASIRKDVPGSDKIKGIGMGFSQFRDPGIRADDLPDELNVDAGTFSGVDAPSYEVETIVLEHRTIRPTAGETGMADGEEAELTSNFYVRGLLVAVSQHAGGDLSGLLARVRATVVQKRPGNAAETVMTATYELVGQTDGKILLRTADSADDSHAVVTDIGHLVDELEVVKVALLPAVTISYNYTATVGVESELTAILSVELVSVPGGTGAGAAFGTNGENIGLTIDAVLGTQAGSDAVSAINDAIGAVPDQVIPFLIAPGETILDFLSNIGCAGGACGVLGVEGLMVFAVLSGWAGVRGRKRTADV